jgi:integrase
MPSAVNSSKPAPKTRLSKGRSVLQTSKDHQKCASAPHFRPKDFSLQVSTEANFTERNELGPRERTLVLLDVPTGMRRGEVLATQWCDIDFGKKTLNVRKSMWQQHLGPVKTEESEKIMPLDDEMITDLLR